MKVQNCTAKLLQLILLYAVASIIFSCNSNQKNKEQLEKYIVINPIQADSNYIQEYVAEIQSIQNVELRARAKGFIERIYVDEGKTVSKGQLLFTLNSSEYKQEIAKAKAQLASAQAELKQADVDIRNAKMLSDNNVVAKSELEVAIAKNEATLAKIQEANATINLANISLAFTEIRAPFNGTINRIPNKVGALVDEGTLLTTISNNNEMYAYFNVSETDYLNHIAHQNNNKQVNLKLANGVLFPQTGIIETIDGEIDRSTGNLSYRARFLNPDKILKHGSSGKVMVSNMLYNAILIPQQSTFEVQENLYVYVVGKDNSLKQRQVIPEMRLANMYVIKEGLSASDIVLYDGVQLVKEGDKITPDYKKYSQLN